MAMTCERFLKVMGAKRLLLTKHSMSRLQQRAGVQPRRYEARCALKRSRKLTPDQMHLLGLRGTNVGRNDAAKRFFFLMEYRGRLVIAVLKRARYPKSFVWVTSLACRETPGLTRPVPDAVLSFHGTRRERARFPEVAFSSERSPRPRRYKRISEARLPAVREYMLGERRA
jgi:hypothetical protein